MANLIRVPPRSVLPWASRGLGWYSLAVGALEVLAAAKVARRLGIPRRRRLVRAFGLREIVAGLGLLRSRRLRGWLWMRVGGDAQDLFTLLARRGRLPPKLALVAMAAVTLVDLGCALASRERRRPAPYYGNRTGFPRRPELMRGVARNLLPPEARRL